MTTVGGQNCQLAPVNHALKATEESSVYVPEHSPDERLVALTLFVLSCAYLYIFRRYTTLDPDEGILLQGAQRIMRGEVLYHDFFSFITPGSYYLLALLFKIFGSSIVVARTALVFVGGSYSLFTYLLARRVCSRRNSLLTAGLVTLTCVPFRFLVLHNWDSTLWACMALYCAQRLVESPRWRWGFGTGSFASLTFLFEQSKGSGLILGIGAGLLVILVLGRQEDLLRGKQIAALALGLTWTFAVTMTYFFFYRSLSVMFSDWFWPLHHYSTANRVSYGYQNWPEESVHLLFGTGSVVTTLVSALIVGSCFLIPALPLGAVGWLPYCLIWRKGSLIDARNKYYILMNMTIAGLLLSVVVVRPDIIHFIYLAPVFFLILAWIFEAREIRGQVLGAFGPLVKGYILVAFLALSMPLLTRAYNATNKLATRRGEVYLPANDWVLEYLQAHVERGETILVHPYLPLYYYLSATFSPSAYDYLQPGMHTSKQYDEVLHQLSSNQVQIVLLGISFADQIPISWPRTPLSAIATDPIVDFVLHHYHTCVVLKSAMNRRFLFMVQNEAGCPVTEEIGSGENRP